MKFIRRDSFGNVHIAFEPEEGFNELYVNVSH